MQTDFCGDFCLKAEVFFGTLVRAQLVPMARVSGVTRVWLGLDVYDRGFRRVTRQLMDISKITGDLGVLMRYAAAQFVSDTDLYRQKYSAEHFDDCPEIVFIRAHGDVFLGAIENRFNQQEWKLTK